MTRTANAKIAGFTFLFYIAAGLTSVYLHSKAMSAEGTAAILASVAAHATDMRVSIVLELLECFCALVLAVTMYGITRSEDNELAVFAMVCRVAEGVVGAAGLQGTLGLLWLATAGAATPDAATVNALGAYFLMPPQNAMLGAPFFAVGSAIFSYLMLRGRMIPIPLAWLGVFASVLLVVTLPLQLAGFFTGPMALYVWMPMLVFEVPLALWLLFKGVNENAGK